MSLHRILNADVQGSPSAPALNGAHMDSPQPVIDPALAEISRPRSNNSPNDQPTRRRSSRHSQSQQRESTVESPPAAASQPLSHIQFMQGPGYPNPNAHPDPASPWEKYDTGEWAPPPPAGASNINPPYASNGNSNGHIAAGAVIPAPDGDDSDDTPEGNGRGRKRKANDDDDADYHPRSGRRVCTAIFHYSYATKWCIRMDLAGILLGHVTVVHPLTTARETLTIPSWTMERG